MYLITTNFESTMHFVIFSMKLIRLNIIVKIFLKVFYFAGNKDLKYYSILPDNLNIYYSKIVNKKSFNFISLINYLFYLIIKLSIGLLTEYNSKNKKHIIIDHPNRLTYIDYNTLKKRSDSTYFQYLFDKIDNDFFVFREELMPKFRDVKTFKLNKLFFLKKKYTEYPGQLIFFRALFSFKIFKQYNFISKKLNGIFDLISLNV